MLRVWWNTDGRSLIVTALPVSVVPEFWTQGTLGDDKQLSNYSAQCGVESQTEPTPGSMNTTLLRFNQSFPQEVTLELSFTAQIKPSETNEGPTVC